MAVEVSLSPLYPCVCSGNAVFLGESGGLIMYLGEPVLGVMEDNGQSITTKALGGIYMYVFVRMPGTQDHIITLAAPSKQLHCILCPHTTSQSQ